MHSRDGSPARGTYRFVHAADLRLDAPVRGIGPVPEPLCAVLRDASLRAWEAVVELAIQRDAAFVVLAGGLFDGERATLRASVALGAGVRRLRAQAIDVFIARTAEDVTAAPRLALLAEGATLFDHEGISTAYAMRDGACLATLHAASGTGAETRRLVGALRPSGLGTEIGVLPGRLAADEARAALTESLCKAELAYWALGGASEYAVLHGAPPIVCAGTAQGRGLDAAERGAKGCVLVEVDDRRIGSAAFIPLDPVRFASFEVEAGDCADAAAVRQLLAAAAQRELSAAADRVLVVEAVLCGRTGRGWGDRLAFERELLSDLRRDGAALVPRLWWARVRDGASYRDRPDAGPGDLRRIVIDRSEALSAPLPRGRFLAQTFAPLLRRWEAESDFGAQRQLVREAARLALDVVDAEGGR